MKLFIQDLGWGGMIVVVEETEEKARNLMSMEYNYVKDEPVQEYEIKDGFIYSNYGDL